MGLPNSRRVSRVRRYLGGCKKRDIPFTYGAITLSGGTFQSLLARYVFCNSSEVPQTSNATPTTPYWKRLRPITPIRFGLFPVRSPLLRKSRFLYCPGDTKMFQFSPFIAVSYVFRYGLRGFNHVGFPHSEIPGSNACRGFPGLIAAYHVLHHLSVPKIGRASVGKECRSRWSPYH